jgi:prevent-host-death family protein
MRDVPHPTARPSFAVASGPTSVARKPRACRIVLHIAQSEFMKTAGIREARQGLSSLVAEVRKGREIVLTEHGRPVARLTPLREEASCAFRSHRRFRLSTGKVGTPISEALAEDRADRI